MNGQPSGDATGDQLVGWLLGPLHRSCLDSAQRPLGEQASPRYGVTCPVREEVRAFGDARDETKKPFNVLALQQLSGCWSTLLRSLSSAWPDAPNTVGRMFQRADAARRLAPLFALKGEAVTVESAALYKVALGFGEFLSTLLMEQRIDADAPPPSASAFEAWLDEGKWLIGEAQVCAGSRAQVRAMWDALGSSSVVAREPDVPRGWREPWFHEAARASLTLEALAASAAAIAHAQISDRGRRSSPVAERLYVSEEAPPLVRAVQQLDGAHGLHPTLLFQSSSVPRAIRLFIEDVAKETVLDEALALAAQRPAQALFAALGRSDLKLTARAFSLACEQATHLTT